MTLLKAVWAVICLAFFALVAWLWIGFSWSVMHWWSIPVFL